MEPTQPQLTEPLELLTRFASGERAAFLDVYRGRAAQVRKWVGRFFRGAFEQEEAAQEVWLTVHRMQRSFDVNRGELGPWLRTLTGNRCRELLRARGRRPEDLVPADALELALDAPGPDAAVLARRLRDAVEAFRVSLPADEAATLQHGLVEELSHDELAQVLGVNVRRSKYLKKKLLERAAADPALRAIAKELLS